MMFDFDEALPAFGKLLTEILGTEVARAGRIIRDIYGRLSFVTLRPYDKGADNLKLSAARMLGAYGRPTAELFVSMSDDQSRFQDLLAEISIGVLVDGQIELRMIDRRLAGDEWLMRPAILASNPGRLIFYSV